MTVSPQRMARSLDPAPDEALPSLFKRLSERLDWPLPDLLRRCGLARYRRDGNVLDTPVLHVTPVEAAAAAETLGLEPTDIRAATALRYDGILFDSSRYQLGAQHAAAANEAAIARNEWLIRTYSPYCPECLTAADQPFDHIAGIWRLEWRVAFTVVCAKHMRLLAHQCPQCGRLASSHTHGCPPVSVAATSVLCGRRLHAGAIGDRCPGDFRTAAKTPVDPSGRLARAQVVVNEKLRSHFGGEPDHVATSARFFETLRPTIALLLRFATAVDLGQLEPAAVAAFKGWEEQRETTTQNIASYRATPSPPALVAATLPAAVEIVKAQTNTLRAERLGRALGMIAGHRKPEHHGRVRPLARTYPAPPTLLEALDEACRRLRRGPRLAQARLTAEETNIEPRHIPQLFWEAEFDEFIATLLPGSRRSDARRFVSVVAATLVGASDWKAASTVLDLPGQAHTAGHYRRRLERQGREAEFSARVQAAIRSRLRREPRLIDYRQLRGSLAAFDHVDPSTFFDWPLTSAIANTEHLAAAWAWAELTSSDPRCAPGYRAAADIADRRQLSQAYSSLCSRAWFQRLQPALRAHAEQLAGALNPEIDVARQKNDLPARE